MAEVHKLAASYALTRHAAELLAGDGDPLHARTAAKIREKLTQAEAALAPFATETPSAADRAEIERLIVGVASAAGVPGMETPAQLAPLAGDELGNPVIGWLARILPWAWGLARAAVTRYGARVWPFAVAAARTLAQYVSRIGSTPAGRWLIAGLGLLLGADWITRKSKALFAGVSPWLILIGLWLLAKEDVF